MAAKKHHIFLIPGFFGFANIGDLLYFAHVRKFLAAACRRLGMEAEITAVKTFPTSSIRLRAERLFETIVANASHDDGDIHLIGHSSGGLDARLVATPKVVLNTSLDVEPFAARIKNIVTISTPHYGTPVASFFTTIFGQKLLRIMSLSTIYVLRFEKLPVSVLLQLGALLTRWDERIGWKNNIADELYSRLLADFSPERRYAIQHFFEEVGNDQALLTQLTPEGMDIFNAATANRAETRYGSVVHYARPPGVISTLAVGLDPYGQSTHAVYYAMHQFASRMPDQHLPVLNEQQADGLLNAYGTIPSRKANDGMVPTLSQVWGELIHATRADHLDVVGHFNDHTTNPPHIDWLTTGTGFDRLSFEALWSDIARFIVGQKPLIRRPRTETGQHLQFLARS